MLSKQNQAILLMAKTKPFEVKPNRSKTEKFATPVAKDEGKAEWVRFKSECVLLKGGKSK
jgi:hypothetical protein